MYEKWNEMHHSKYIVCLIPLFTWWNRWDQTHNSSLYLNQLTSRAYHTKNTKEMHSTNQDFTFFFCLIFQFISHVNDKSFSMTEENWLKSFFFIFIIRYHFLSGISNFMITYYYLILQSKINLENYKLKATVSNKGRLMFYYITMETIFCPYFHMNLFQLLGFWKLHYFFFLIEEKYVKNNDDRYIWCLILHFLVYCELHKFNNDYNWVIFFLLIHCNLLECLLFNPFTFCT